MKRLIAYSMVGALALFAAPGPAFAQSDAFQDTVQQGFDHYRARRYEEAVRAFEAAYQMRQEPELVYNIARAQEKGLKREEAIQSYERFLSLSGTTADLRSKALASLQALRTEQEALQRAKQPRVSPPPPPTLAPPPPASAAPPPPAGAVTKRPEGRSKTLEWVLIGGGAAVVATGAVFGVLALQANSDFDDRKAAGAPADELRGIKSDVDRNAIIADVLIGAGIVSAGVGIILLVVRSDSSDDVALTPMIGPDTGGLALTGRF